MKFISFLLHFVYFCAKRFAIDNKHVFILVRPESYCIDIFSVIICLILYQWLDRMNDDKERKNHSQCTNIEINNHNLKCWFMSACQHLCGMTYWHFAGINAFLYFFLFLSLHFSLKILRLSLVEHSYFPELDV